MNDEYTVSIPGLKNTEQPNARMNMKDKLEWMKDEWRMKDEWGIN